MNKLDDENFHPKLSPPKARGQVRIPFISRVVKASAKAGNPIGRRLHSPSARPGAKLGRGQVAARLVGQHLGPRARRGRVRAPANSRRHRLSPQVCSMRTKSLSFSALYNHLPHRRG